MDTLPVSEDTEDVMEVDEYDPVSEEEDKIKLDEVDALLSLEVKLVIV